MKVLLIAYDNQSYMNSFPLGLAYIASSLREDAHDVVVYSQDIHHYSEEHLTKYLDENRFDVVGVGIVGGYYQYAKIKKISKAINSSKHRPIYILGGHGPTPEPEFFLSRTQADIIVMGEGEATIVELLNNIDNLKDIKGIAYRDGKSIFVNERRELIKDIDTIPFPAWDLFPIEIHRLIRFSNCTPSDFIMPVLSGRGCPYKCAFCYRMEKGFRKRKHDCIISEVEELKSKYGINYVMFLDELLMISEKRTVQFCKDIIDSKIGVKWYCNGRLNYAKKDVLQIMKEAGCIFVNYGIEAYDDDVLRKMNKQLTTKEIVDGIENTIKVGISPGFNMIFGNIGDNAEVLKKNVEFLKKYDDCSQLRTIKPVTPYPGSPLYYHAIEKGLLEGVVDFYDNKHVNSDLLAVNLTDMSDEEFYTALRDANLELMKNYFDKKLSLGLDQVNKLYNEKDTSFRGFRQL